MNDLPLKKIIWLDSNTRSGWQFPQDQKYGPLKVTSVGYVVVEAEDSITLSGSVVFGEDYQACDTICIPRCCILSEKDFNKR